MLYRQGDRWFIAALAPDAAARAAPPTPPPSGPPSTGALNTDVDRGPRRSARRVAADVPRGVAHPARVLLRPEPPRPRPGGGREEVRAVPRAASPSRSDLNYLFAEMLGDITVGHLGVGGGDAARGAARADRPARRRLRRSRTAATASPGSTTARTGTRSLRAPLTQPGVNVPAGEYLLAVNGRAVTRAPTTSTASSRAPSARASCCASARSPTGEGSREVTVVPVASEQALRNSPGSRTTAARWTR